MNKLEPEANVDHPDYYVAILSNVALSQAISLKRIADAMEKLTKVPELSTDGLTPEEIAKLTKTWPSGYMEIG